MTCEQHTAQGRSDCVAETDDYVYLFEFKVDKNADEALNQIYSKGYAGKYYIRMKSLRSNVAV